MSRYNCLLAAQYYRQSVFGTVYNSLEDVNVTVLINLSKPDFLSGVYNSLEDVNVTVPIVAIKVFVPFFFTVYNSLEDVNVTVQQQLISCLRPLFSFIIL